MTFTEMYDRKGVPGINFSRQASASTYQLGKVYSCLGTPVADCLSQFILSEKYSIGSFVWSCRLGEMEIADAQMETIISLGIPV